MSKSDGKVEKAAARAVAAIDELLCAAAVELGYCDLDPAIISGVGLVVNHGLSGRGHAEAAAAGLAARARETVAAAAAGSSVWRDGGVYCFQCDSPDCIHSEPTGVSDVFAGYHPTGKPIWMDFAHLCMDRRVDGYDRLFLEKPPVLAVAIPAADLTGDLLDAFRQSARGLRIAGCVAAGLIPADFEGMRSDNGRTAVSFVAWAVCSGSAVRLRLGHVGLDPDMLGVAAGKQGFRGPAEGLRRSIEAAGARLNAAAVSLTSECRRAAAGGARISDAALAAAASPVMNRLRSDLESLFKGGDRRTKHAEHRVRSGERPTSPAVADAMDASETRVYSDEAEGTVIVAGPKGRCHVFTRDARLVTSMALQAGEIETRVAKGRWKLLDKDRLAAFRGLLSHRTGASRVQRHSSSRIS